MSCGVGCGSGGSPGGGRMGAYPSPARQRPPSRPPTGPPAGPPRSPPRGPPPPARSSQRPPSPRPQVRMPPPPRARPPPRPLANSTMVRPPPTTMTQLMPQRIPEERPLAGREDLANSVMEDIGEGGVWNEASAMSLSDYPDNSGDEEDDGCPPCDQLDNITPQMYNQSPPYLNISDETPPTFADSGSGGCPPCDEEESSLGLLDSAELDAGAITALAEAPSNISVYDAEELNITTAPRNADWDIQRNRIWQTISSSLDETEQQEEDEYMAFVADMQSGRREFFESSE